MTNSEAVDAALVERYRAAYDKLAGSRKRSEAARADWIEATLELAAIVLEARERYPDHNAFSRWLGRSGLEPMHPSERMALLGLGRDPETARRLMAASTAWTWRGVWEKRPNREPRAKTALYQSGKGVISPGTRQTGRPSGQALRKRAARIPTVMQEPVTERPIRELKPLTREQVDPDFKGTTLEFATKYGHVNLHTKAELEHHKQQEVLSTWLGAISEMAKVAKPIAGIPDADPAALAAWLAKSGKAEKFNAWLEPIAVLLLRVQRSHTAARLLLGGGEAADADGPRVLQ